MYAGTTFRHKSGNLAGVHQKIDRVARRNLNMLISKSVNFPTAKEILVFEGKNGPDSIKYMSPVKDKPWHFIDPSNPDDRDLIQIIQNHIHNLAKAIARDDKIKASFEAAWLAHSIVDGLTPAHHYPLHDKIEELWGKPRHEITGKKTKSIIKGSGPRDTILKNWEYYGAGGVMTVHIMFELGIASAINTEKFKFVEPNVKDITLLNIEGFEAVFIHYLRQIDNMKMYDQFCQTGWTRRLTSRARKVLIPDIIKVVTLAWYQAVIDARMMK